MSSQGRAWIPKSEELKCEDCGATGTNVERVRKALDTVAGGVYKALCPRCSKKGQEVAQNAAKSQQSVKNGQHSGDEEWKNTEDGA